MSKEIQVVETTEAPVLDDADNFGRRRAPNLTKEEAMFWHKAIKALLLNRSVVATVAYEYQDYKPEVRINETIRKVNFRESDSKDHWWISLETKGYILTSLGLPSIKADGPCTFFLEDWAPAGQHIQSTFTLMKPVFKSLGNSKYRSDWDKWKKWEHDSWKYVYSQRERLQH